MGKTARRKREQEAERVGAATSFMGAARGGGG